MKKIALVSVMVAGLCSGGVALAQNCTGSTGSISGANSGTSLPTFDSCTASNQLAVACSGLDPIGTAQDAIWTVTIGPGAHSGNFTITPAAGYDVWAALMSTTCSGASACPLEADSAPAGGAETLGTIDALANGTYFLIVSSFSAQCGNITVQVPTAPVSLQTFSVN